MRAVLKQRGSRKRSGGRVVIDPTLMELEEYPKYKRVSPHVKKIDSERSKEFKKLNKNRNCMEKDFKDCIDRKIGIYGDPIIIGNGTFGILLRVKSAKDDIAIKFIFNISNLESAHRFIDMEKELSFSYYMGATGIGPEVLDSFYYNFDFGELKHFPVLYRIVEMIIQHFKKKGKIYPQFYPIDDALKHGVDPGNLPVEIQCIVMKAYDSDCEGAIIDPKISVDAKADIVKQMVNLLEIQIKNGLYCYDVKPGNFVVNIKGNHVDVKMIDFGADFCTEKKIYIGFANDAIIPNFGINYVQLLYISNVIQIFALVVKTGFFDSISPESAQKILRSFFDHMLFGMFFSINWQQFIDWYIDYANNNYLNGKSDPANNVVWYSNTSGLSSMSKIYSTENLNRIKHFLKENLTKALNSLGVRKLTKSPPMLHRQPHQQPHGKPGFTPKRPKGKSPSL
jgi:hypothetical protein